MNNNLQKSSLADKVIGRVQKGRIKMKPRIYFALRAILIILSVVIVSLFVLFLVSFIVFALRTSGAWVLPGFGLHGIRAFFHSLPWFLILSALLLIVVLETLVKHFAFSYRRPILYSVLGILIIVLLGTLIVNNTQFHSGLLKQAQSERLPVAGKFYRDYGIAEVANMHYGIVSEVTEDSFSLGVLEGETFTVIIADDTHLPRGKDIKKDDEVLVFGEKDNGTVRALGVRKINKKTRDLLQHRFPVRPKNMK